MVIRRRDARAQVRHKKATSTRGLPRSPEMLQAQQSLLTSSVLSLVGERERQTGILRGVMSQPNLRSAGIVGSYAIKRPRGDKGWREFYGVQPKRSSIAGSRRRRRR